MKFGRLTGTLLAGATVLSALAMAPIGASFAATQEGNAEANGGVALPQTDNTTVGISFGDNSSNGNTGYLRLQMVPHVLDFGNHEQFYAKYPVFMADGKNMSKDDNNRHPNYEGGDTNQTAILNTSDTQLAKVAGKAWATVVDKQDTRDETTTPAPNTSEPGSWTLSVKADDSLQKQTDQGNNAGVPINDAVLSFDKTAYGRTQDIFALTAEEQDQGYDASIGTTDNGVTAISSKIVLPLSSTDVYHTVATAADGEGRGANVFGWNKTDIQLTLPAAAVVENAIYTTTLTWQLSTGIE